MLKENLSKRQPKEDVRKSIQILTRLYNVYKKQGLMPGPVGIVQAGEAAHENDVILACSLKSR